MKQITGQHESQAAELLNELNATGPGYDERRQAAVAGLLVLGQEQTLMDALVGEREKGLGVRTYVTDGRNGALVHLIVDAWETLARISGEVVWKTFRGWDVFVWQLTQLGKRQLALTLPANLVTEAERQAHLDVDVFRALSVLRQCQQSFRELCLSLFSKLRNDQGRTQIGWGDNEVSVGFEAARYLAEHYAGEAELGSRLDDIAQYSHEPSGPIVILCRGWQASPVIQEIWNSSSNQKLNAVPATAWIVSVKATPEQFADYVLSLPEALLRETWWRFPRETMRAVRHRLTTDLEAQRIILASAKTSLGHAIVASISRLLGTVTRDRRALREWARGHLQGVRVPGRVQPMGYDMVSGRVRPVEFCSLEACLTS